MLKLIILKRKEKSMKKYKVWVCLEGNYEDIEAENEEEAFIQASEFAISGANWNYTIEEEEEEEEN